MLCTKNNENIYPLAGFGFGGYLKTDNLVNGRDAYISYGDANAIWYYSGGNNNGYWVIGNADKIGGKEGELRSTQSTQDFQCPTEEGIAFEFFESNSNETKIMVANSVFMKCSRPFGQCDCTRTSFGKIT